MRSIEKKLMLCDKIVAATMLIEIYLLLQISAISAIVRLPFRFLWGVISFWKKRFVQIILFLKTFRAAPGPP
jgi:ABC-type uncharacterized transport system permease subunit